MRSQKTEAEKKIVIWDLGAVVLNVDPDSLFKSLAKLFGADVLEVVRLWCEEQIVPGDKKKRSLWHILDRGGSEMQIYRLFVKRFGKKVYFDDFLRAFKDGFSIKLNKHFLQLSEKLHKAGVEQFIFSNITVIHQKFVEEKFGRKFVYVPFENRFYSCVRGVGKPEGFTRFAKYYGIKLKDAYLVDDRRENIFGIRKAGGNGILFKDGFYHLEHEMRKQKILK